MFHNPSSLKWTDFTYSGFKEDICLMCWMNGVECNGTYTVMILWVDRFLGTDFTEFFFLAPMNTSA